MKTEKKRSFRGAVLLTVVSVMSLLIVFLTSTLVLATAANNRAHKSYSSSQANYTARATIDSILAAAKQNENFAIAMNSLKKDGESFEVDVAMESSATGIGKVDNAKIAYAGKKQFYDASKQEWVERDLISVTADVTSGGETKTVTAYVLKDPPAPGGGGGGGGGFVTVGTAGTANHTISFGGTYLGIGMSKGARYYQGDYHLPGGQIVSLEDKFYLNREDDQPGEIDVTTGLLIPNTPENYKTPIDNNKIENGIVTYSFGNEGSIEAPVVINGNYYSNTKTEIYFPAESTGLSVWGSMAFQNQSSFTVNGNVDNINPTKFNEIPYIYVDALFDAGGSTSMNLNPPGSNNIPLNIFCGSAKINQASISADIYCQDSNKTSTIVGNSLTTLYKWSDSVINGSSYLDNTMSGSLYSKGNVDIKLAKISKDVKVEKDLTISASTIYGDVVCGGTLTITNNTKIFGNVYCKGIFSIDTNSSVYGTIYNNDKSGTDAKTLKSEYDFYLNDFYYDTILPNYAREENTKHEDELRVGYREYANIEVGEGPFVPVWTPEYNGSAITLPDGTKLSTNNDWTPVFLYNGAFYKYKPYEKIDFDGNPTGEIVDYNDIYYRPDGSQCGKDEAKKEHYTEWDDPYTETSEQYYYYHVDEYSNYDRQCNKDEAWGTYYLRRNNDIYNSGVVKADQEYAGVTFFAKSDPSQTPITDYNSILDSKTINSADDSMFNEIYPRKAEKAVILGLEEIGDGTPMAESKVLKTVDEIEDEYNFSSKSITEIPSEGNYLANVNANVYKSQTDGSNQKLVNEADTANPDTAIQTIPTDPKSGDKDAFEIKSSCTLKGGFVNNIVIKNESVNDIWIKLDDFELAKNGINLIYDDSTPNCGNLNIYVENKATLNGCGIYTKSYKDLIDSHTQFQIANKKKLYVDEATGGKRVSCPKINIYSKKSENDKPKPKLTLMNNAIVTAAIEAPHMEFILTNAKNLSKNDIYYNGRRIAEAPGYNGDVGVIGILNVAEGKMSNEWVFLYTPKDLPDGDDSDDPDKVSKEFDVMYYEGF